MTRGRVLEAQRTVTEVGCHDASGRGVFSVLAAYRRQIEEELVGLGAKKNQVEHGYEFAVIGDGEARVLILTGKVKL